MSYSNYNNWLNDYVKNTFENNDNKKNIDYVKYFYKNIYNILTENEIKINNEKEFRKEIGLFIYNNSNK